MMCAYMYIDKILYVHRYRDDDGGGDDRIALFDPI